MKVLRWLTLSFALLAVPIILRAQTPSTDVPSGTTVHDNLIRMGTDVRVDGTLDGDLLVAAQTVTIPKGAVVEGDLIGFATTFNLEGTVKGSVRVAAQTLNLGGTVGRNITAASSAVSFSDESSVLGTTALWAEVATLKGSFGRNVTVHAAQADLGGNFHGDARIQLSRSPVAKLTRSGPFLIEGTFHYRAPERLTIPEGMAKGAVSYEPLPPKTFTSSLRGLVAIGRLVRFIGMLVVGFVLLWMFPRFLPAVAEELKARTGRAVITGLALFVAVPVGGILLALTYIGIPLVLLLGMVYALALCAAKLFVGAWLGGIIAARSFPKLNAYARLAIGFAALELVLSVVLRLEIGVVGGVLQLIGGVASLFILAWVPGALTQLVWRRTRFGSRPA